jgi:murein L,D-transpeptidase YcbB/YkuD
LNVGLSGAATSFFVLANANANIVQASMANSLTLSLAGVSAGTDSLTVCAIGGGGCNPLSVTVTGPTSATATSVTVAAATTTPASVAQTPAAIAQSGTMVVNAALLTEIQALQAAVTQALAQMQSIQTQLGQLEAQVNAGSGSGISANASAIIATSSGASYNFTELLTVGSQDAEVTALQNRLTVLGFYSGPITGYYGSLTGQAVSKYQTAHSIAVTGYVGPSTRTALNAGN